jgi:integrase/recombinase XerC
MEPTQAATWQELLPPYIAYLEAGRKSPRTVELRVYQVRRLAQVTGLDPKQIKTQHLIDMLSNPDWKPNTAATARASYASFFGWASNFRHLKKNPAAILPSVKVPAGQPKPASDDAVARALETAPKRTQLMVRVGPRLGLQRSLKQHWADAMSVHLNDRGLAALGHC